LFTAREVFIGHAFERPMVLSDLSRNLEMPRVAVRRKLQRLIEIGLVERVDHRYYMTAKANAPLQREVLLAHLRNMQFAVEENGYLGQRFDGFVADTWRRCLVYFGYPRAHEDDAERAVQAGLELVRAVTALSLKICEV
jgi:predicted ArsR family transcriptional regulator